MLQLLDQLIAIPIAIYLLEKSGTHIDIDLRVKEVLLYVTSCGTCLHKCKATGQPMVCKNFCLDCFSNKTVCDNHKDLYDCTWQCDEHPCEHCMRLIQNGTDVICRRFRVMLSIYDQDPAYEKFGHLISTSLTDFLDGNGSLSYPFYHIHDIGHNLKNSQASLDRGTHFDGKHCYDSTDLAILLTTVSDEVVQTMSKGISHKAISQLDKHSDEQSLQRVSDEVIEACSDISELIRTDVPELRRLWFSESHEKIVSPLFISVSLHGIVFFTDDNSASLVCYRQNPLPRKLIFLSSGSLDHADNDEVPFSPETTELKKAKWQMISGLTLIDDDTNLLVTDFKLGRVRIISKVDKILQNPKARLKISNLNLHGFPNNFHPFAIRKVPATNDRILVTDPKNKCLYLINLSDLRESMSSLHVIHCENSILFPIDCLCYGNNAIILTEGLEGRRNTAAVHIIGSHN